MKKKYKQEKKFEVQIKAIKITLEATFCNKKKLFPTEALKGHSGQTNTRSEASPPQPFHFPSEPEKSAPTFNQTSCNRRSEVRRQTGNRQLPVFSGLFPENGQRQISKRKISMKTS